MRFIKAYSVVLCFICLLVNGFCYVSENTDSFCTKLVEEYYTCYSEQFKYSYQVLYETVLSKITTRNSSLEFFKSLFTTKSNCNSDKCHCLSSGISNNGAVLWGSIFKNDKNLNFYKQWLNEVDNSLTPMSADPDYEYNENDEGNIVTNFCKKYDWKIKIMSYEQTHNDAEIVSTTYSFCKMQPYTGNIESTNVIEDTISKKHDDYLRCIASVLNKFNFNPLVTKFILLNDIMSREKVRKDDLESKIESFIANAKLDATKLERHTIWVNNLNEMYLYRNRKYRNCSVDESTIYLNTSHFIIMNKDKIIQILFNFNNKRYSFYYDYSTYSTSNKLNGNFDGKSTVYDSNKEKLLEFKYFDQGGFVILDYKSGTTILLYQSKYLIIRTTSHLLHRSSGLLVDGCHSSFGNENHEKCEQKCRQDNAAEILKNEHYFHHMCTFFCETNQDQIFFIEEATQLYVPYNLAKLTDYNSKWPKQKEPNNYDYFEYNAPTTTTSSKPTKIATTTTIVNNVITEKTTVPIKSNINDQKPNTQMHNEMDKGHTEPIKTTLTPILKNKEGIADVAEEIPKEQIKVITKPIEKQTENEPSIITTALITPIEDDDDDETTSVSNSLDLGGEKKDGINSTLVNNVSTDTPNNDDNSQNIVTTTQKPNVENADKVLQSTNIGVSIGFNKLFSLLYFLIFFYYLVDLDS